MLRFNLILLLLFSALSTQAQTINAAYVKALYKQYPTQKSDLCPACKVWVNPYYCSIADTDKHVPLITYYIYTKAHRIEQENVKVPRTGIYAAWHAADGQPDETQAYKQANKESPDMIAKGHCQAWILLAWCADAAILSDTYTFNAAMEYQGQNIGTEIATEELCRDLSQHTDSIRIWCGTFGSQKTFTSKKLTMTLPSHYYKIIRYHDPASGQNAELCYWMPNLPTEKRALLTQRQVTHEQLVANLGYDPTTIFH